MERAARASVSARLVTTGIDDQWRTNVRFTVSKSSKINGIGFEAATLGEATKIAADLIDGKRALERVQIFDAETDRYYDETQILELLRKH